MKSHFMDLQNHLDHVQNICALVLKEPNEMNVLSLSRVLLKRDGTTVTKCFTDLKVWELDAIQFPNFGR